MTESRPRKRRRLAILGGGVAGLATGYYAKKSGLEATVYEARPSVGGLCVTLKHGRHSFDSGAHRFHDKFPEVTADLKLLIGSDFKKINVPSKIYADGRFVHFPFEPMDLMKNIGLKAFLRTGGEVALARIKRKTSHSSFFDFATQTYGRIPAGRFLLNYTEKLWGLPSQRLSPLAAGERLKGLSLRTFLKEAVYSSGTKALHLEGSFYYPRQGIGIIARKLAEACGLANVLTQAEVTRVLHGQNQIRAVEINGRERVDADEVVSTLPLDAFLRLLDPPPPPNVLEAGLSLRYRSLILAASFLERPSVTPFATLYLPQKSFLQTRVYEPRNRSPLMSPEGQTSLVAEIPCQMGHGLWGLDDGRILDLVTHCWLRLGWVLKKDILGGEVVRIPKAYPVLELGYEKKVQTVMKYLQSFPNLRLAGRNALFRYEWIHNAVRRGREIISEYLAR